MAVSCGSSHEAGPDSGMGDDAGSDADTGIDAGADAGDVQACDDSQQCIVVPQSCCGSCGAATRGDAIGVHRNRAGVYRDAVCQSSGGCPPCFMEQDPTLVATCRSSRCEVVDLQVRPLTECAEAGDCKLRSRDCCECGGDTTRTGLIAIRSDAEQDYRSLVCAPDVACRECLPSYPDEASAACSAEGRCVVEWDSG